MLQQCRQQAEGSSATVLIRSVHLHPLLHAGFLSAFQLPWLFCSFEDQRLLLVTPEHHKLH